MKPADVPMAALTFIDGVEMETRWKWYFEENLVGNSVEAKTKYNGRKYSIEFNTSGKIQDVEVETDLPAMKENVSRNILQALDSMFNSHHPWELRLRYRITAEIPLNGQSVDPGEFYLKLNNEYLNSWQEGEPDLEIRLVPLAGFEFTDNNKLEFGLDYRLSSFIDGGSRNSFWFNIGWFLKV